MSPFLFYMIKVSAGMAIFYLAYSAFLSRDTLYARNRIYILLAVMSSFIFPMINIQTEKPMGLQFFGKTFHEVVITPSASWTGPVNSWFSAAYIWHMLVTIYFVGLVIAGIRVMISLIQVTVLVLKGRKRSDRVIYINGMDSAGFSAMGYIFISTRLTSGEAAEIIKHEQNHLDLNHFADILLIESIKVVQWFNPFMMLFDRSLREVHEFQADEGCLKSGTAVLNYQRLLLSQIFSTRIFNISNSFSNPALIKKRMIMMTKKRSRTLANLKLLLVLPVIAVLLVSFSSCKGKTKPAESTTEISATTPSSPDQPYSEKKVLAGQPIPADAPPPPPPPPPYTVKDGDTTWTVVEQMPKFPGGDEGLLQYIAKNTSYPEEAKTRNIQGRVVLKFVVKTDGKVDNVSVVKSVAPDLDAEAVRVVSSLPAFEKPGVMHGKPVPVWYMVPITFSLK